MRLRTVLAPLTAGVALFGAMTLVVAQDKGTEPTTGIVKSVTADAMVIQAGKHELSLSLRKEIAHAVQRLKPGEHVMFTYKETQAGRTLTDVWARCNDYCSFCRCGP